MAIAPGVEPEIDTRDRSLPSVLAVVVTHNGRRWLSETLVGLNSQTYQLLDVLVVDDATFDSRERPQIRRIAKRHLKGRRWGYLRTPRALGFGGAINWAMSRVRTDADLLLFIHDDAALTKDSVEHMVARLISDEGTAIVGPKIVAWDDPQRLEEVGMLADRFGYPYKGLEEGEIDLGQHDSMNEVFYVTSTCMLMRHEIFRQLRGWDSSMRAFSEDLDLCWRARLRGHSIRVEPRAQARHAIALARGERPSPFLPARYYIRRNRLRTITKNTATLRLVGLIPQFILLAITEMLGFVVLRQPREILNLLRALAWNAATFPQTLAERRKAQRGRTVSDLKLSRLTVKQSKRVRFYISHQRDRMEEAWGRRAELLSKRTLQARVVGGSLRGWLGFAAVLFLLALLIGFRNIWWSPQLAVGELLPFPDRATGMWRAFLSPWRGVGLGQAGPNSPALALLGLFPLITLGAAGAAQKLLLVVLGVTAFVGAYKLVSDLVDRSGRVAAGLVYALGSVGFASIRAGSLGAMVFGAAAPFVLHAIIGVAGWSRPPNWTRNKAIARIGLGGAVSAAFVPGSLFVYLSAGVLLVVARAVFVRGERVLRALPIVFGGLFLSWALLLPWSWGWFAEGGTLDLLRGEDWRVFAASFNDRGMLAVLLGQVPDGPVLWGLALPLLGLVALLVGEGQRRRMALALWSVITLMGMFTSLFEIGWIRPFVSNPVEAGVIVQVCFAGLVGLGVGAFRLDLPRRGFGLLQGATLATMAASAFLLVVGLVPSMWAGDWAAGKGSDRENAEVVAQIKSLFQAEAQAVGPFRALWVGEGWTAPIPIAARPIGDEFVTGARGQVMTDLFERHGGQGDGQLQRVIASVEQGATDRGGSLLGAFNIHFVVLERGEASDPWLAQRDLALVRSEDRYLVLRNDTPLERAALYPEMPDIVDALDVNDPTLATGAPMPAIEQLRQSRAARFVSRDISTAGTVFVAESRDRRWQAEIDGEPLEMVDAGWGNAFTLPAADSSRLTVAYPSSWLLNLFLFVVFLAWVVTIGASFSKRRPAPPEPRVPRRPIPTRNERFTPPETRKGATP